MNARPTGIALKMNALWRRHGARVSSGFLVGLGLIFLTLNRASPAFIEKLQVASNEVMTPVLSVLSRPVTSVRTGIDSIGHFFETYHENDRLRADNAALASWRDAALRLEAENAALRTQLHVAPDPAVTAVLARVVGDAAGGFVESVLVAAGDSVGIAKGDPVVAATAADSGLPQGAPKGIMVGRIVQTGNNSARALLITDVSSRIPVTLEQDQAHAILAGDNSGRPVLLYLPAGANVTIGERVVTSATDGMLPPGLPIGVVAAKDADGFRVEPLADLSRLDYVQVLKYQGVAALPLPPAAEPKRGKKH